MARLYSFFSIVFILLGTFSMALAGELSGRGGEIKKGITAEASCAILIWLKEYI